MLATVLMHGPGVLFSEAGAVTLLQPWCQAPASRSHRWWGAGRRPSSEWWESSSGLMLKQPKIPSPRTLKISQGAVVLS